MLITRCSLLWHMRQSPQTLFRNSSGETSQHWRKLSAFVLVQKKEPWEEELKTLVFVSSTNNFSEIIIDLCLRVKFENYWLTGRLLPIGSVNIWMWEMLSKGTIDSNLFLLLTAYLWYEDYNSRCYQRPCFLACFNPFSIQTMFLLHARLSHNSI